MVNEHEPHKYSRDNICVNDTRTKLILVTVDQAGRKRKRKSEAIAVRHVASWFFSLSNVVIRR